MYVIVNKQNIIFKYCIANNLVVLFTDDKLIVNINTSYSMQDRYVVYIQYFSVFT